MKRELVLTRAQVITPDAVVPGTVLVRDGRIAAIDDGAVALPAAVDLEGDYLVPGLVELHTDNLEKHFAPRPGVRWPALPAMMAHDAQLAAAGITTVLDALALGDVMEGGTRIEHLDEMAAAVTRAVELGITRVEHHLHLRCEISYAGVLALFERFVDHALVKLVSLMDHAPGQRQFASLAKYREYYQGKYRLDDAALEALIAQQRAASARYSDRHRCAVAQCCRSRGIPLASHDDATDEHVREAVGYGTVIAEFPTTLEAARAARAAGLHVMMGGPNLVRGLSHSGNVSARELATAGLLDTLSSDYCPASSLQAAFVLGTEIPGYTLPAAIATVTANPADAAGLADRGRIAPGLRGDLARVQFVEGVPVVREVWREGRRIV